MIPMDVQIQKTSSRRNFLTSVLIGWSAMIILPVVYAIYKYVVPPKIKEQFLETLMVGRITDIPINSARIVKFNKTPIVIVHTAEDQIKAYSAICTHLGCVVQYNNEERNFHCNCHGSIFDLNGKNISGPAPKPLIPFKVELKEDDINIFKS